MTGHTDKTVAGEVKLEPVAWLTEWQFRNQNPTKIKYAGGGSSVTRSAEEAASKLAFYEAWERVESVMQTPLYPASTVEALKAELERLLKRLDIGPHGEDAIDVLESSMGHLTAERDALLSRVERLEKALKPFADYAQKDGFGLDNRENPLPDDGGVGWVYLTNVDFRNAAAASRRSPMQNEKLIDLLSNEIRRVDGNHSRGAGALAEALVPFILSITHSPAVNVSAVADLCEKLEIDAENLDCEISNGGDNCREAVRILSALSPQEGKPEEGESPAPQADLLGLREKVAKAMCERDGFAWDAASCLETGNGDEPEQQREYWLDKADAALSAIAPAHRHITVALERAALAATEGSAE